MASTLDVIVEEVQDRRAPFGLIGAEERGVRRDAKPLRLRGLDCRDGLVEHAVTD